MIDARARAFASRKNTAEAIGRARFFFCRRRRGRVETRADDRFLAGGKRASAHIIDQNS